MYSIKMINTYNESSLHKTLKKIYSLEKTDKTEVEKDGFIFDIITNKDEIIEIQTQNIEKLQPKIEYAIKNNLKIKIVIPIITKKNIITKSDDLIISKRTSPKKENIYDLFRKIIGIHNFLSKENLTLEILFLEITEHRNKLKEKTQSQNNKRRYKKDWIKTDKSLDKILSKTIFNKKDDYLELLPKNIPEEFSSKELKELYKSENKNHKNIISKVNAILWVLNKADFTEFLYKKDRLKYYKISQK